MVKAKDAVTHEDAVDRYIKAADAAFGITIGPDEFTVTEDKKGFYCDIAEVLAARIGLSAHNIGERLLQEMKNSSGK